MQQGLYCSRLQVIEPAEKCRSKWHGGKLLTVSWFKVVCSRRQAAPGRSLPTTPVRLFREPHLRASSGSSASTLFGRNRECSSSHKRAARGAGGSTVRAVPPEGMGR